MGDGSEHLGRGWGYPSFKSAQDGGGSEHLILCIVILMTIQNINLQYKKRLWFLEKALHKCLAGAHLVALNHSSLIPRFSYCIPAVQLSVRTFL